MFCQYRWICCSSPQGTQSSRRIDKTIFPSFIHSAKMPATCQTMLGIMDWARKKILKAEIGPELWRLCISKISGKELSEATDLLVCGSQNAGKADNISSRRSRLSHCLGLLVSNGKWLWQGAFFSTYFEIIINSEEGAKIVHTGPRYSSPSLPQ